MPDAPISCLARLGLTPAAEQPQARSEGPNGRTQRPPELNGNHDQRIALVASVSGGKLNRLNESIRLELASMNGDRDCDRLRSGSVDCTCDYCEAWWERLAEKLNGGG